MGMMDMVRRSVLLSALHKATEGPAASLSFTADARAPLASAVVDIVPVQAGSGDPSPDNIRQISGYTGVSLLLCGKNLIDQATAPEFPRWINTSNKWAYSSGGGKSLAVPCLPNTTYTVSIQGTTTVFRAAYITGELPTSNSQEYVAYDATRDGSGPGSIKVTTGADATYIVVQVGAQSLRIADMQIEFGSTATAYEAFRGGTFSYDWTSGAGTIYYGTLDVKTGVLTDYSAIRTLSGGSDEAWEASTNSSLNAKYFRLAVGDEGDVMQDEGYCVCDHYAFTILSSSTTSVGFRVYNSTTLHKAYIGIRPENVKDMTLNQFKALLADSPVTVCYQLTSGTTHQLTPNQIRAFLGRNNMSADAGTLTVHYWKHN